MPRLAKRALLQARRAGASVGLIYRHFGSKAGWFPADLGPHFAAAILGLTATPDGSGSTGDARCGRSG